MYFPLTTVSSAYAVVVFAYVPTVNSVNAERQPNNNFLCFIDFPLFNLSVNYTLL